MGWPRKRQRPPRSQERVKNNLENFFPLTMRTDTVEEVETQEEEKEDYDQDDFESQISLNSSNRENGASTNRETGASH